MRVFANPVGPGSLWFDNLATADGTPVAYDPQARAFLHMLPFCANRGASAANGSRRKLAFVHDWLRQGAQGHQRARCDYLVPILSGRVRLGK